MGRWLTTEMAGSDTDTQWIIEVGELDIKAKSLQCIQEEDEVQFLLYSVFYF